MKQALEEAKLGWLRQKDVTNKPAAVVKLFPKWFREQGVQKFIAVGGDMPVAFQPEPEDGDDEEHMEGAREVKPGGPRLRMRGKQTAVDPMEELEKRYVAMLRTWLAAKPRRTASAADVMRFLRDITGFSRFATQYPLYAKADCIANQFPLYFEVLPGRAHGQPVYPCQGSACSYG